MPGAGEPVTIRLDVTNLDEVRRVLEQLGPKAVAAMPAAIEEGAKVLQARMVSLGPGPYIEIEMDGSKALIGPDKAHFYYCFSETGTSAHLVEPRQKAALKWGEQYAARSRPGGMAAEPFMRPAVDEGAAEVGEAMGKVLLAAVE